MFIGHLAVSALEHRYLKAEFVPVMAAAVAPDVVDKIAHYVLHKTPHGRFWGHTLLGLLISTALILLVGNPRAAWSWALGYLSHLLCDLGGVVPWLYPFVTYEYPPDYSFGTTLAMTLSNLPKLALEFALSLWALAAMLPEIQAHPWYRTVMARLRGN